MNKKEFKEFLKNPNLKRGRDFFEEHKDVILHSADSEHRKFMKSIDLSDKIALMAWIDYLDDHVRR